MVSKKERNSIHNVDAYNSFSSLGSDHRLVTTKIRLSLRMSKTPAKHKYYDWSVLRDKELQEKYTITVRDRYAEIYNEEDDITEQYGKLVQSNAEASEKLIPVIKRAKRRKLAEDARVEEARTKVQKVFETYNINTSTATTAEQEGGTEASLQ